MSSLKKINWCTSLPDVRNDNSTFRNLMPLINIFLCWHMGNACQVDNQFKFELHQSERVYRSVQSDSIYRNSSEQELTVAKTQNHLRVSLMTAAQYGSIGSSSWVGRRNFPSGPRRTESSSAWARFWTSRWWTIASMKTCITPDVVPMVPVSYILYEHCHTLKRGVTYPWR